jgi:hypothetical protein
MLDDVLSDSMFTGYMHGYNLPNMDKKELSKKYLLLKFMQKMESKKL